MEFKRNGSQPSARGPAEYFTGTVRIDALFKAPSPARASGAYVTFEPCARSNWHTHPLGQTLVVTSGCGLVQSWGGPIKVIRPGDVVSCPAGEKHWHGATPTTAMTHIAIQEELDGKVVDWMEKVPDQLRSHLAIALKNGVTQDELVEAITHLAFYAGWPSAVTAISVAKEFFQKN